VPTSGNALLPAADWTAGGHEGPPPLSSVPAAASNVTPVDRRKKGILAILAGTGTVAGLDNSILNVALPTFVRQLHASNSELQWIVDAFVVVYASFMISSGSLGDRWGRARTWKLGMTIFMASTAAAAFSTTPTTLILFRSLMGLGATMTLPVSLSMITHLFIEPGERARAIGVWTAANFVGLATGPVIGGALLTHFWWGSVFLVTVPVIVVMLVVGIRLLPESKDPGAARFDPLGVLLSAATFGLLLWGVIEAPDQGWLSAETLLVFGIAVLAAAGFFLWESHNSSPMLDLSLFTSTRFTISTVVASLIILAFTGALFLVTQLMQFVFGYSPFVTGLCLVPMALVMAGVGAFSPAIAARVGIKPVMIFGPGLAGGACLLLGFLSRSGLAIVIGTTALIGAGIAIMFAPSLELALGAVSRDKAGLVSGTNNTVRQFGTAMGIAVIGSVYASGYRISVVRDLAKQGIARSHLSTVTSSVGSALQYGNKIGGKQGALISDAARHAFVNGATESMAVAGGVCFAAALLAGALLPRSAALRAPAPWVSSRTDFQSEPIHVATALFGEVAE
jgi:EmrB/QacA subfamily drug resistance transporter